MTSSDVPIACGMSNRSASVSAGTITNPPPVTQIAAASKAIELVGFKLVASGLTYCVSNPEEAAESGYDLDRVEKMFLKIG